jgi:hypothetical protein
LILRADKSTPAILNRFFILTSAAEQDDGPHKDKWPQRIVARDHFAAIF